MVRVHLTLVITIFFSSSIAWANDVCDKLYSDYTKSCSDTDAQCRGVEDCQGVRQRCVPSELDLSDQQTCDTLKNCVTGYYRERMANGELILPNQQCKYKWTQPTLIRDSQMNSCRFKGLPWDPISNRCPGASVVHQGETFNDRFFRCEGHQRRWLDLHVECERAKSALSSNRSCSISIRQDIGLSCPHITLSPAVIALHNNNGVGERETFISAHSEDTEVVDTLGLQAKPSVWRSAWEYSVETFNGIMGR